MRIYNLEELTYPGVPMNFGPEVRFTNRFCDPRVAAQTYAEHLDEWALCEELGFDGVFANEHHFTGFNIQPDCNVTAAALIQRTKRIKVGVLGNVLALRHPVAVAEAFASLDCMSNGRFMPGVVRGLPQEYISYNADPFTGRERFEEAYGIIQRCLNEEIFDHEGKHWNLTGVSIWPKPVQKPLGPFWMPAGSMESIRFAARNHIVSCQVFQPTAGFKEVFDAYRQVARDEFGWAAGVEQFAGARFVHLAEDNETAMAEGEKALAYLFRVLGRPIRNPAPVPGHASDHSYDFRRNIEAKVSDDRSDTVGPTSDAKAMRATFERMRRHGWCVAGDPDFVAKWLETDAGEAGYGNLIVSFRLGNLSHEQVLRSKRLFAQHVLPRLRAINHGPEPKPLLHATPYEVRHAEETRRQRLYRDFNYQLSKDAIEVVDEIRDLAPREITAGWLMRVPQRHIDGSPTEIIFPGPCDEHRGCAIRLRLAGVNGQAVAAQAKVKLTATDGQREETIFESDYGAFSRIPDQHAPEAALAAQRRVVAGDGWSIALTITVPADTPEPELEAEDSFFEVECFKQVLTVSA